MVLAYHTIITMYGFWLPNDPRGSGSDFVRNWELLRFGKATKVTTSRSLARAIRYVVDNPLKESNPPQHWSFVTPYTPV